MRRLRPPALLALFALLTACGTGPETTAFLGPRDTLQVRGTLLSSGNPDVHGNLVWVAGTDLVAFVSSQGSTGGYAVKTVDAASGNTGLVDGEGVGLVPLDGPFFYSLVAAPDGSALYYMLGIGDPRNPEWQLRVADPSGGRMSTLRSGVSPALAVSPDGRYLVYVARGSSSDYDSLIVRDLTSGAERHYADYDGQRGTGGPILFSANGTDLLYGQWVSSAWPLRRLSLADGAGETVSLPDGVFYAQLFHWGASGIEALAEVSEQYRVLNLTTGGSVLVGTIQQTDEAPYEGWAAGHEAWSADGSRVAYWIGRCHQWAGVFDCAVIRYALYVADAHSGTRVRVAYTSRGPGPTVFSPDGRRILYYGGASVYYSATGGEFYSVDVP